MTTWGFGLTQQVLLEELRNCYLNVTIAVFKVFHKPGEILLFIDRQILMKNYAMDICVSSVKV